MKTGCDTRDRVAQTFICMLAYILRWWAAAAVKSRWPLSLNGFEGEGWHGDCRVYEYTKVVGRSVMSLGKVGTSTVPERWRVGKD